MFFIFMEVSGKSALTKKHTNKMSLYWTEMLKMICKIVNKVQKYSKNLCIKLSLKCILIDTWKGTYLMNQFLKICIGSEKTTPNTLQSTYISFHLIVHLLGFSMPLIWMGDLTAKCKQNLWNTKTEYVRKK